MPVLVDDTLWVPTILSVPLTWCSPAGPRGAKFGVRLRGSPVIGHCQYLCCSVPVVLRFAYLVVLRVFGWLALLAL